MTKTHDDVGEVRTLERAPGAITHEDVEAARRLAEQADTILLAIGQKALACPPGVPMHEFLGLPLAGFNTIEQSGVRSYREGDTKQARRLFRLALGLSELCGLRRPTALRGLAACDHRDHEFVSAVGLYRQALALDASDEISLHALADCLEHMGPEQWGTIVSKRDRRA